jgi:beta-N-acetylhexosaminidase
MSTMTDHGAFTSFRMLAGLPGPELDRPSERALRELRPAGIILFSRNLASPTQARDLAIGVREMLGPETLIAIDQEGGSVNRLASLDPRLAGIPPGRTQAAWPPEKLRALWAATGRALAALGIDVDFAPVVDLDDGPPINAVGPRSFGTDRAAVTRCARAVLEGLAAAGVRGCLKHFPGLGRTDRDTHRGLAVSACSEAELWSTHVEPFRRLAAVAPMVMTAHAHYPAVDPGEPLPATFSAALVRSWLRQGLGFAGTIVSDDLEMGALHVEPDVAVRARRAVEAGVDALLFCHGLDVPRRALDGLDQARRRGELDEGSWRAAADRVARLRRETAEHRPGPAPSVDGVRDALDSLASLATSGSES